jgi:2-polyprenyl-3-methyl-5-hydroxy-6-metoxy-1,4-benzoquinol methylase
VPGHWIGPEVFGDLQGKIGLAGCRSCGLVFANPRPSAARLAAFYSGDTYCCHEASGSSSAGSKADYLLKRITNHLSVQAPRTLLDYGAGGGGFLCHARDRGWRVCGFEPGKRGLESCRRAGLDVTDSLEDLPTGEFSLITLHHVFEHLANPVEVLDGARRLLAPGGRLFVEVPNAHSLRARLAAPFLSRRFRVDERYRAYPIHLLYYSDSTLRSMFAKAGWKIEKTFTVGLGLDEYLVREKRLPKQTTGSAQLGPVQQPQKRRLRHLLRDTFLGLGLGENLAAIAHPERP